MKQDNSCLLEYDTEQIPNFDACSSQQFATVLFDRGEDREENTITVIKDGMVHQFKGDNRYNPSIRRHSSCVYAQEECTEKTIKICTIQHKGWTYLEVHSVSREEYNYLFSGFNK